MPDEHGSIPALATPWRRPFKSSNVRELGAPGPLLGLAVVLAAVDEAGADPWRASN